jgi:hypothetical protein
MSDTPRRRPDAWVRPDGDHAVIHIRDDDSVHRLNATAYAIWVLCDGHTNTDEMAAAVAELTGMGPVAAADQVKAAVADLRRAGLLSRSTE